MWLVIAIIPFIGWKCTNIRMAQSPFAHRFLSSFCLSLYIFRALCLFIRWPFSVSHPIDNLRRPISNGIAWWITIRRMPMKMKRNQKNPYSHECADKCQGRRCCMARRPKIGRHSGKSYAGRSAWLCSGMLLLLIALYFYISNSMTYDYVLFIARKTFCVDRKSIMRWSIWNTRLNRLKVFPKCFTAKNDGLWGLFTIQANLIGIKLSKWVYLFTHLNEPQNENERIHLFCSCSVTFTACENVNNSQPLIRWKSIPFLCKYAPSKKTTSKHLYNLPIN